MKRLMIGAVLACAVVGGLSVTTEATFGWFWHDRPRKFHSPFREKSFQRIATLGNYLNVSTDPGGETVSEIIAATENGRTLIYTDAIRGLIGLIDITTPSRPQPLGTVALDTNPDDDVEHSPTSVAIVGNKYALVAVDTSL